MEKIILLSFLLLFMTGCGSKRQITSYSKGYSVSHTELKKQTEEKATKQRKEDRNQSQMTETKNDITKVTERIFDSTGRVMAERETLYDNSISTTKEKTSESVFENTESAIFTDEQSKSNQELKTETEAVRLNKKAANPIWNWLGVALAVCIILLIVWKVLLKR